MTDFAKDIGAAIALWPVYMMWLELAKWSRPPLRAIAQEKRLQLNQANAVLLAWLGGSLLAFLALASVEQLLFHQLRVTGLEIGLGLVLSAAWLAYLYRGMISE